MRVLHYIMKDGDYSGRSVRTVEASCVEDEVRMALLPRRLVRSVLWPRFRLVVPECSLGYSSRLCRSQLRRL